jgi:hypothetical protein
VDSAGVDVNSATLQDALDATTQAKKDVWKEYQQSYRDPNVDEAVNTTPVADAIRKTVTKRQTEQNPGLVDQINKIADTYDDRNLSVGDIEDRVRELNNETAAIEARYNMQKRIAKADPANAPIFAERDTLRQLMLDKMDELSGEGAAELRKKYGALNSVEDAISRRIPVAERQNPMGLAKILSRGMAYGKMAGGILTLNPGLLAEGYVQNLIHKNAEKLNNPDWLTQQALRKTQAAGPAPAPVERVDGEYITEPAPKQLEGGQQALPPGQYDQPGGAMEPLLAPRQPQLPWGPRAARPAYQLPEKAGAIPLPVEFPVPSNTRETVGIPEAQEPGALQRAVDQKGQPQPLSFLKRGVRGRQRR